MNQRTKLRGLLLALALSAACANTEPLVEPARVVPVTIALPAAQAEKPVDLPGVHNLVTYTRGIVSGSVPEGDAGFESLAAMGIRSIVSVDGAAPDVELARRYGLRYVHLPIGYDGFSLERALELAKAVQSLPGPVFIHCHHGKHRSAGAAASAAVTLGQLTSEQAVLRMKVSGTAPNYTGLYECATTAKPASAATLAALPDEFPERIAPKGLKKAMIAIDEANDELKAIEKASWKVPADHPDLVPAAVVKRMIGYFNDLTTAADTQEQPAEFAEWLAADVKKLQSLHEGLSGGSVAGTELSARMKLVQQSCKDCHSKYRD
ncbi:MAG: hypothetical protein IPJ77_09980 [Planctomycetes bacterium]|nr:hypothetical protein [Planctomycetota bacterium]